MIIVGGEGKEDGNRKKKLIGVLSGTQEWKAESVIKAGRGSKGRMIKINRRRRKEDSRRE